MFMVILVLPEMVHKIVGIVKRSYLATSTSCASDKILFVMKWNLNVTILT